MEIKAINVERSTDELYARKIVSDELKKPSKAAVEIFKRKAYPNMQRGKKKDEC